MDEQDLRDRLLTSATAEQPPSSAVSDDLARGQRARRRRKAEAFGALGVVAALATVTAGFGPLANHGQAHNVAPLDVAGSHSAKHAHSAPATSPVNGGRPTSLPQSGRHIRVIDPMGQSYAPWRDQLFRLARHHLDPAHQFLNYDTDSLQEASNGAGHSVGIKMGWKSAHDTGEGMVSAEVATAGVSGLAHCWDYPPCHPVHEPGYGKVRIGGDPSGPNGYEVILTQADGETATVVVDPLFGNNSLTPTGAALPSLKSVLALAADPNFNLPTG